MITFERALNLSRVTLFRGLDSTALRRLAEQTDVRAVPAGTMIVNEGERGRSMYVVVEGEVTVLRGATAVAQLSPGDYFGEMSLIDDEPRAASVEAAADSVLLVIERDAFRDVIARHSDAALEVMKTLARRLRAMAVDGSS